MKRTPAQWREYCITHFRGGYTPEGKAADLYASGQVLARLMHRWGAWDVGQIVADVGCGNGRLAFGLLDKDIASYIGLDVIANSIEFCKQAFANEPRFRFYHLDVRNAAYYPGGKQEPAQVVYPLEDQSVDAIIANSLFSHTETQQVAQRNLSEMHRILKVGGTLFSTWRLVPPHPQVDNSARHTNYRKVDALAWITDAGFEIQSEVDGLPREIHVMAQDAQIGFLATRVR